MTVSGSGDVVPEVIYLHIDGGGVPRSDDRPDIFIIRHPLFVVGQKLQSLKHFRRETIFIQILEGDIRVLDNIVEEADYFLVLGLPGDANGEGMEDVGVAVKVPLVAKDSRCDGYRLINPGLKIFLEILCAPICAGAKNFNLSTTSNKVSTLKYIFRLCKGI